MSSQRGVCFDWEKNGSCSRGNSCRFDHPASRRGQGQGRRGNVGGRGGQRLSQGICHEFQRTGNCRFGSSCKYRHAGASSQGAAASKRQRVGQQLKKDASMAKFIKALAVARKDKLGTELSKSSDLWRRCWKSQDLLDDASRRMMLEILARIPGSSSIEPPPIQFLENVSKNFLQKEAAPGKNQEQVLTSVKTVRDVLATVLQMEWDCTRGHVVEGLSNIVIEAESKLRKQNKDHRETASELMTILEDMDRPWRIQTKDSGEESNGSIGEAEVVKYDEWKAPTVEWLCTPEYFSPSSCPKMKIGRSGVYESAEEYMDCSHRLWVAMTFFDGHAAFAPHCRSRGNNGMCGSALWPVADSQSQSVAMLKCRQRCGRPAEFSCRIKGHDSLCRECAAVSIANHRGGPGSKASTHIYDAQVNSVNSDGVIFLTGFKSRNPPPNAIHWRTTKRLAAPNLIALVLLKARGSVLAETDAIKWAEVVNHPGGNFRDEERRRQSGQLAVNASAIVDLDPDYFERGSPVAIIDCMCFVPEWIPVLRALDSQRQTKLPFENGRHLNLIKDFPVQPADEIISESIAASHTTSLIKNMIESSQLEPIREVRRDDALKQQLASKLEQLVTSTTLDNMQLVSFVEALRNPVHLTQGPPGTGKSYLGVVLVRALIIIRDLWMQKSRSRGASPILVLSYKNHAIDEFLVDLVKALPSLSRNQLIRIGGQCKDNRLAMFSERATYHSDPEVQAARATVDALEHLRESVQFTMDHNLASFRSYYHQIFFGEDEDDANRRKALIEATLVLMECIIRLDSMAALAGKPDDGKQRSPAETAKMLGFLLVDPEGKSSTSIQKQMRSSSGSALIPALANEARVAKKERHWGDHLEKWLTGKVPLPCCTYSEHCNELALSPQVLFCSNHLCYFMSGIHGRCTNARRDDTTYFCSKHGCEANGCEHQRLGDKQTYCKRHACWRCLELGLSAQLAEDGPPRNVCEDHPLCFFPGCTRTCEGDEMYCKDHVELKCQALTKKKRACKGKAISALIPFCENHRHLSHSMQVFQEAETDDVKPFRPQEMPRCNALTKKGKQCKGDRMPGSKFCFDHAPPIGLHSITASNIGSSLQECSTHEAENMTMPTEGDTKLNDGNNTGTILSPGEHNKIGHDQGEERIPCQEANTYCSDDNCESEAASFATANDVTDDAVAQEVDEMDIEEEEGENMQHLREVFEVNSGGESEDELSETSLDQPETPQEEAAVLVGLHDPKEWSWDLSLEQRWDSSQALMEKLRAILSGAAIDIKASLSAARLELQQAKTRAKARVYENKKVIGGTMVGCISRLDSIRKTKPFAVVVEEASEVLEPLLFSCLSESTLKLEMIGDHRQLQPSVMSRYEFELCNRVNISMFQRLIEAPCGHKISSTVLSVQRRMRKNICDLTRDFYSDVTEIEDHATCENQKIGDRLAPKERSIVATSQTNGREVPGIIPHVFLWTHNGIQERAHVGISRINTYEAKLCCALASYLVECGVPRPSIVCLTPYKGQLMLLKNTIIKDPRSSRLKLLSRDPNESDIIRLSTIDRFQGDEEDIVICSLVVDENSKTGFVKLVNRMIVLLSRARLGLYILGNTGYFKSNGVPKHWGTTFERLQLPVENDSPGLSTSVSLDSRTGSQLPICCPVHRDVMTYAASSDAIKQGFCKEPCQHQLRCGHVCSLDCHWPNKQHNSNCTVKLDSPCQRHPAKITCNKAFSCTKTAPASTSYKDIMSFYQCPNEVSLTLPCNHVIKRPCHVEKKISDGSLSLPKCQKPSPTPYVFPACGHELNVTCEKLEDYKADPELVKCQQDELYEPACGHSVSMACYRKSLILSGDEMFVCSETVPITLPRCGHGKKVSCPDAQKIATWSGIACEEVGKVKEGKAYGPQDYTCNKKVTIHRKCGHQMNLPCNQAFARLDSLDACRVSVLTRHPCCGHNLHLPCKLASDLADQNIQTPDPQSSFVEGQVPLRNLVAGVPSCMESVQLQRTCGHIETLQCSEVCKPRHGCRAKLSVPSPLCGHTIDIFCHLNAELLQPFWSSDIFSEICQKNIIRKEAMPCRDAGTFGQDAKQAIESCKESTRTILDCGHEKKLKCFELLSWLSGASSSTVKCEAIVSVDLPCGHKINVECHERKVALTRPCIDTKLMKCWNFEVCQHQLKVPCDFTGIPACTGESSWTCPAGQHSHNLRQCSDGVPEECSQCALDKLAAQKATPVPFDGENNLRNLLQVPEDCIEWIAAPVSDFLSTESTLLDKCLSHANRINNAKKQFLLTASRIPCFRSLTKKNQKMKGFEPKKCVNGAKSFHGIISRHLTGHNLKLLATKEKEFNLLVGYASIVHTKVLHDLPPVKPNAKKTALARNLVGDGYDSMSFVDENGFQNLLVFDPFPMIGVSRLKLTREQLEVLASKLDRLGVPQLESRMTIFRPPTNGCTPFSTMKSLGVGPVSTTDREEEDDDDSGDDEDDDESTDEPLEEEASNYLKGTEFEELNLNVRWSGGFDLGIPRSVERNLEKKMQFVNSEAPAFAGLQMIRTLLAEEDMQPLHLLMAAESVSHSSTEARESLNKYRQFVQSDSPNTKLHPWALIIAARLEENSIMQEKLLSAFHHFFPLHEKFLLRDEIDIIRGLAKDSAATPDVHSILLQEWHDLKAAYPGEANSATTVTLLNLTGLRKVKQEVIRLWKTALQLKRMDDEARKENQMTANYCFLGNPGTGKTTVARLFAQILCDAGIRANNTIKETTAQQVKDDGSDKFRKLIASAIGGVLFIDEAYDLDPVGDSQGKPIVNELLTLCENDRDKISVILAGYEDDFQKKFFAYNDGLKSRFKEVMFEDFDETELATIWTGMRTKKQWNEEENVCSVAVKRIVKLSGKKGFGNAREVRRRLEEATQSAMTRLGENFSQDTMVLKIEDVIGDDPRLTNEKLQKVLKEINEKIGWTRVKDKVKELIELCGVNYQRELLGKPQLPVFLNRMFLGSPGTGKTTCAKLYGRLLKELGFLSNGDVVPKTASDFVGQHVGQSQKQTNQILQQAQGKVLIIDESYALNDSLYGKQVLDTLVEKVQGTPSDDIAVLLLGYEQEMLKMLQEQNPGLMRRFPQEHAFYFDDYDDKQLLAILELNLKANDVEATLSFREKALDVLRVQRKRANFGNAGSVELLVKGAVLKVAKRAAGSASAMKLDDLDIEDPGAARADKDKDPLSQLDKLYQMQNVKAKLEKMKMDWEVQRREGGEEPDLGHFVFLGAPGTGKTTVARAIADILFSLGLLGSNKIVETTGLDLTGEYMGQTKTKVEDKLKEAKGGVLFIDEAYNLGEGQFGKEACDTLVAAMTSEDFSDVLICIAGYPNDINKMLNANAGLKSRFTQYFQFLDWEEADCMTYFKMLAEKEVFEIEDGVLDIVCEGCGRIRQLKGWGNGRDLVKLWKATKSNRSERVHSAPELEKLIKEEDVRKALNGLIQARIGKLSDFPLDSDPLSELDSLFRMEGIKEKLQRLQKTWAVSKREGDGPPTLGHFVFTGSPGTGKTSVARAIARVLFGLQLKPSDKLLETSALDLQAPYLGQTAAKVNEKLSEAKGACLFIDEAYNLSSSMGQFATEACDALVAGMTSEEFKDVQIIIAGYPHEIDDMFKSNAGLKSRFTHFFQFPDWRPDDCVAFFQHCAEKENFVRIEKKILQLVRHGFEKLVSLDGFANGRDVTALWDEAKRHRAVRVYDQPEESKMMHLDDVEGAMTSMLQSRLPKSPKNLPTRKIPDSAAALDGPFDRPYNAAVDHGPTRQQEKEQTVFDLATLETEAQQEDVEVEKAEKEDDMKTDDDTDQQSVSTKSHSDDASCEHQHKGGRDDGVSDDVWAEIQAAKEKEKLDIQEIATLTADLDAAACHDKEAQRAHEAELRRLQEEQKRMEQEMAHQKGEEEQQRQLEEERLKLLQEEQERIAQEMARQKSEQERQKLEEQKHRREEELRRQKEKKERRQRQEELQRRKEEEERRRLQERLRRQREKEARRQRQAELERRRKEEALRRMEEAKRKKEMIQQRLRKIGKCPAGFEWHQCGGGWRCGGGSHFVSDLQLQRDFGYDA